MKCSTIAGPFALLTANKPVNFVSAQLAVLARDSGDWRIRTIHWSSRRR
jgi:hypothetical protein